MDQYDDSYKLDGGGYKMNNPIDVSLRNNLGYARAYAVRMNLAAMTPQPALSSTGYTLAYPQSPHAEYLVYFPNGGTQTVNLSGVTGALSVEWFNPATGVLSSGGSVMAGTTQAFTPPFGGDAVLYLSQ